MFATPEIVLPEFVTTGMGFLDELADAALPPEGAGLQLMRELALRHGAVVGGSFICRDEDGENRNAWFCAAAPAIRPYQGAAVITAPDGEIAYQRPPLMFKP